MYIVVSKVIGVFNVVSKVTGGVLVSKVTGVFIVVSKVTRGV